MNRFALLVAVLAGSLLTSCATPPERSPSSATTPGKAPSRPEIESSPATTTETPPTVQLPDKPNTLVENAVLPEAETLLKSGFTHYLAGNFPAAITEYTQAIQLSPAFVDAYFKRGNAYRISGNLKNALEDYDRVIALEPNSPVAFNNRGATKLTQGALDQALLDSPQSQLYRRLREPRRNPFSERRQGRRFGRLHHCYKNKFNRHRRLY